MESIIFKAQDIIDRLYFSYWNSVDDDPYMYREEDWFPYDSQEYGRCFTLVPSNDHILKWIKTITLSLIKNTTIHIHTPGMFLKDNDGGQERLEKYFELGKEYQLFFNCEYHELLDGDYEDGGCKKGKAYSKDLCVDKMIDKVLNDKVGCTTPFGPNKTQICKREDNGDTNNDNNYDTNNENRYVNVDNEYQPEQDNSYDAGFVPDYDNDYDDKITPSDLDITRVYSIINNPIGIPKGNCLNPCSFFSITTTKSKEYEGHPHESLVVLNFAKVMKVYETYNAYSWLSLIAEIGGYVGLFLGVSINQLTSFLDFLFEKFQPLNKKLVSTLMYLSTYLSTRNSLE